MAGERRPVEIEAAQRPRDSRRCGPPRRSATRVPMRRSVCRGVRRTLLRPRPFALPSIAPPRPPPVPTPWGPCSHRTPPPPPPHQPRSPGSPQGPPVRPLLRAGALALTVTLTSLGPGPRARLRPGASIPQPRTRPPWGRLQRRAFRWQGRPLRPICIRRTHWELRCARRVRARARDAVCCSVPPRRCIPLLASPQGRWPNTGACAS